MAEHSSDPNVEQQNPESARGSAAAGVDVDGRQSGGSLPELPPGDERLSLEDWRQPLHLRFRVASIAGGLLSAAWLVGWYQFVETQLGWDNLLALLPHELTGLLVGMVTPLAMLWTVIAFFERGRQLRSETEALRWHLRQLI
jgi:hypothetical protein